MPNIRSQLDAYDRSIGRNAPGRSKFSSVAFDQSRLSNLGCGSRCLKLFLMGQTILILIIGITICAVGSYANNDSNLSVIIGSGFITCTLAMGAILLVIGAIGLASAMNENRVGLMAFNCLMICVLIILLALGGYAVSKTGQEGAICSSLWQSFGDNERQSVEEYYFCCGGNFPRQLPAYSTSCPTNLITCQCPKDNNGQTSQLGCVQFMAVDYKKYASGLGTTAIVFGVLFIATVINACLLSSGITAANEELLRRPK